MSDEIRHTGSTPACLRWHLARSLVYHAPFPSIVENMHKAVYFRRKLIAITHGAEKECKNKQSELIIEPAWSE